MSQLACPHCRGLVEYVRELAGNPVACPHCGKHFILPPSTSPAPPVPSVAVQTGSVSVLADRHRSGMTAATSWLDLFDFKFEKYLTPWIVRLTWAVALVVSTLWLAIVLFSVIWALVPSAGDSNLSQPSPGAEAELGQRDFESPDAAPPSSLPRPGRSAERRRAHWEFRPPELPSGTVLAIASAITALVGIIVAVLWVRVLLETVIVVFNIATTLKDIDRKLTPGKPSG